MTRYLHSIKRTIIGGTNFIKYHPRHYSKITKIMVYVNFS